MSEMSSSAISLSVSCVSRSRRKSVRTYCSPARRARSCHGRLLHSSRSHGSRTRGSMVDLLRRLREVDLRRLASVRRRFVERIVLEAEQLGGQIARELPARRVVLLHRFVVALPGHGKTVLSTRELVHQAVELLVGLQLRIVLDDGEESSEG